MDIKLKIHQGTGRLTGVSLCKSCKYALVREDRQGMQVFCGYYGSSLGPAAMVRSDVRECSAYYNKGLSSLHAMTETAWTLRTEKNGRGIGFTPPDKDKNPAPPQY